MLKFFIIQAIVIWVLGSCIYTLITGKDISNNDVWSDRLFMGICVLSLIEFLVIMIMGFISSIINSKKSKSVKTSDEGMNYENQLTISAQIIGGRRLTQHIFPEYVPPYLDTLPKPPEPPPPPPPPMPWN